MKNNNNHLSKKRNIPVDGTNGIFELDYGLGCPRLQEEEVYDTVVSITLDPFSDEEYSKYTNKNKKLVYTLHEIVALKVFFYHRAEYITHGYRHQYTFKQSIKSIFTLHNETFNIWTHLLAFFYFTYLGLYHTVIQNFYHTNDVVLSGKDSIFLSLYLVCAAGSMLTSTIFHVFNSISSNVFMGTLKFDLLGIVSLMFISILLGTYYGLTSLPRLRLLYVALLLILFPVTVLVHNTKCFMQSSKIRMTLYLSIMGIALVIAVSWVLTATTYELQNFGIYLFSMLAFYSLGFTFYVLKMPERVCGGNYCCDIFFHSHIWWHIFVSLGDVYDVQDDIHAANIQHTEMNS